MLGKRVSGNQFFKIFWGRAPWASRLRRSWATGSAGRRSADFNPVLSEKHRPTRATGLRHCIPPPSSKFLHPPLVISAEKVVDLSPTYLDTVLVILQCFPHIFRIQVKFHGRYVAPLSCTFANGEGFAGLSVHLTFAVC